MINASRYHDLGCLHRRNFGRVLSYLHICVCFSDTVVASQKNDIIVSWMQESRKTLETIFIGETGFVLYP